MSDKPTIEVENIGHLGLVSAISKKYGLVDIMGSILPKNSNRQNISHAEAIMAMIYMGLGFGSEPLYLVKQFFKDCPLELLFRTGVIIDDFNDDVLGRALDAISAYGPTKFFFDIAGRVIAENKLFSKFYHMDSSSIPFGGKKYKDGNIKITYGHSKDHRPDLKQIVQLLITTQNGLPFWSQAFSGNASDKTIFQDAVEEVQTYFDENLYGDIGILVADSSLYSKDFLLNKKIKGYWITRVPESVKMAKNALERDYDDILWTKIDSNYKYTELESTYGGKKQRWLLVRNRKSKYKEIETLRKRVEKDEELIKKKITKLQKKVFHSKDEIKLEKDNLKENYKLFNFKVKTVGYYERKKGQKRKVRTGYTCTITSSKDDKKIKCLENRKGKFILATNQLDDKKLSAQEIMDEYRGRNANIEGNFKFLKSSTHRLSAITLRDTARIEAMMSVMALSLLINNLGQMFLRKELVEQGLTVPNQVGKEIQNPTLGWVFKLLKKIVKVTVTVSGKAFEHLHGIDQAQKTIIRCFGKEAAAIYGFP